MKSQIIIGALLGAALTFGVIEIGAIAAGAPPSPAPGAGRFQAILLHPDAGSEWSAILDTQTGCIWGYMSDPADPAKTTGGYALFRAARGANYMASVNYDPLDFTAAYKPSAAGGLTSDYGPAELAMGQEARTCATVRRSAIGLETK